MSSSPTIVLQSEDDIRSFISAIVKEATSKAEVSAQFDDAHSATLERERQAATARNIDAAVGSGADDEEDEQVDEDEDDLFADEPKKKAKPKKKAPTDDGEASLDIDLPPPTKPDGGDADAGGDDTGEKKRAPRKPGLPKTMHAELPDADDVTVDMVVDRLNVIRSGRSMRDEAIAAEMKHYFDDLSGPERLTLLAYLTGLAQIATSAVTGEEAEGPDDIQNKLPGGHEHARPEPEGEQATAQQGSSGQGPEDASPPIRVGGRGASESLRRRVRNLL